MTWEIVAGLITIVGFLITLITAVIKIMKDYTHSNNEQIKTLTEVTINLKTLNDTFVDFRNDIKQELKENNKVLQDHENRLTKGGL